MLGKHVSAKVKLDMVLSAVSGICKGTLCYCDTVMSLGWAVLSEATKKTNVLEMAMGSAKGAGSSNRMGSTMPVTMYKRSARGVNLPTDVTARVLESRDVISLPDHRLTYKIHAEQGKLLLGKLREEMSMVTINKSQRGSDVVVTGGKRSVSGQYTKDDMLSAFLLLHHTKEELQQGEETIRVQGEVYYR